MNGENDRTFSAGTIPRAISIPQSMRRLFFGLALAALFVSLRGRRRSRTAAAPRSPSFDTRRPTYDDIALRAYFIGLDHEINGDRPDPLRDWAEAEHELLT